MPAEYRDPIASDEASRFSRSSRGGPAPVPISRGRSRAEPRAVEPTPPARTHLSKSTRRRAARGFSGRMKGDRLPLLTTSPGSSLTMMLPSADLRAIPIRRAALLSSRPSRFAAVITSYRRTTTISRLFAQLIPGWPLRGLFVNRAQVFECAVFENGQRPNRQARDRKGHCELGSSACGGGIGRCWTAYIFVWSERTFALDAVETCHGARILLR
jgi:hypothetical protein